MISDDDKRELSDVVLRMLDEIEQEYGDEASLRAGTLVVEITVGDDGTSHGIYKSMPRTTTAHSVGLLEMAAQWLKTPDAPDVD